MKVKVDGELCSGQGRCYSLAPAVFGPDEEGYNRDRDTVVDIEPEHEKIARRGMRACPENAISVLDS